ncbi:probable thimet oligopeptidase isoform X2 [Morus notabilis]|uniref:probable thimet oligopeptidase isoform X2 n=1 Tax=Morus notabilis TaxID=981085 RepID=UPI000CECFB00|nr:probable thimet oligopeptidase isoform X2 [Morus notabilis]
MAETEGNREKMPKQKGERSVLALTGAAAILVLAVNFGIKVYNSRKQNKKKKDLPGSKVRVNLSALEILKLADQIIAKSKEIHDAVASVPLEKVTYTNSIFPLAELEGQQFPLVQSCVFPKLVAASDDVRKASAEAERRLDAHVLMCRKREDVYRVVKAFVSKGELMSAEAKRYALCLMRDFERNGLNLTSTKREEMQRLRTQIDNLSFQYIQNLNDDNSFLLFSEAELAGLPLEFLKVGKTRKMVAVAYSKRCGEVNLSVLEDLVQLRHKFARLLGYSNYADYAVDLRMAKTPSKVFEFLEDISSSLNDLAAKELKMLKDLKKKEEGELPFGIEDLPYYVKKVQQQEFDLDFGDLKQYFPVNLVLPGIFKIVQDLFGLRFEEIDDSEVWHSDVRVFSVLESGSGELMGYSYLDMYTREGKYNHTCVVGLQNGALSPNSARQIPVVLLLSQFQKDEEGQPGLLRFSEVVNFFHEFGHVVQHICNRASFVRFSGLGYDPDFVEVPAQVLENWCYEISSLKLISGFYQDITRPIKDETCKSLKRWRYSFSALKLKQEILYCLFDQIIHSADNVDSVELFKHLHPKILLGLPVLEGSNPASRFPCSAIGYEAACYSRIWSEVFATDIFSSKFRGSLLNQYVGMQFRNKVLVPGGSKEPIEVLSDFLGREPSIQAFVDARAEYSL